MAGKKTTLLTALCAATIPSLTAAHLTSCEDVETSTGCVWCEPAPDAKPPWKPDAGIPAPEAVAPAGWHRWPFTPEDCAVFVPDDLSTVAPPAWEPCPFMEEGCKWVGAPWAAELGWGYGNVFDCVATNREPICTISRRVPDDSFETILVQGDDVLGAWRVHLVSSQCNLAGPNFRDSRYAILRLWRQYGPYTVVGGPPESLMDSPTLVATFDGPVQPASPSGASINDRMLVVHEAWGRFTVRYLPNWGTFRPEPPPGVTGMVSEGLGPDYLLFVGWTYGINGIWAWPGPENQAVPVLVEPDHSHDELATDGVDMGWIRSTGFISTQLFERYELYTAKVTNSAEALEPRKIADLDLPGLGADQTSVGDGWIAVRHAHPDVRLYDVTGRRRKRLPLVEGISWQTGPRDLYLRGGKVFAKAYPTGGPGNDVRWIVQMDLEKLPDR